MPSQSDIRQAITDQIIAALESGKVPPWRRPWRIGKNAGAPANVVTKRAYRGLNPILLDMANAFAPSAVRPSPPVTPRIPNRSKSKCGRTADASGDAITNGRALARTVLEPSRLRLPPS
jgi:hypothetical protein